MVEEEAGEVQEDEDQEVENILYLAFQEEVILHAIIATKKGISPENVENLLRILALVVPKVKMVDASYAMKKAIRKLIVQREEVIIVEEDTKTEIDLFHEVLEVQNGQEADLILEKVESIEKIQDRLKERVFENNLTLKVNLPDLSKNIDRRAELKDQILQNVVEDQFLVPDQEAQKTLETGQDTDQCRMTQSVDKANR